MTKKNDISRVKHNSKTQIRNQIANGHTAISIEVSPLIRQLGSDVQEMMLDTLDEWTEEFYVPSAVFNGLSGSNRVASNFAQEYASLIGKEYKEYAVFKDKSRPYYHLSVPTPYVRHIILFYVMNKEGLPEHSYSKAVVMSRNCQCGSCPRGEWMIHPYGINFPS
tara:strand:- start:1025 stop:1519 length:495 start_codon:yes stop_codon:yes gene_type:complete